MTRIRPASPSEAVLISALAYRSKAYWNYSIEQLSIFKEELSLKSEDVLTHRAHVLDAPNPPELIKPDKLDTGLLFVAVAVSESTSKKCGSQLLLAISRLLTVAIVS